MAGLPSITSQAPFLYLRLYEMLARSYSTRPDKKTYNRRFSARAGTPPPRASPRAFWRGGWAGGRAAHEGGRLPIGLINTTPGVIDVSPVGG
jgi:hypothetical protein